MRHEAGRGIDVEGVDFLRAVVRDGFDIHPAFGRDDERNAAGDAIDKQGEVEFVRDIEAGGDGETVDLLARVAGLPRPPDPKRDGEGKSVDLRVASGCR